LGREASGSSTLFRRRGTYHGLRSCETQRCYPNTMQTSHTRRRAPPPTRFCLHQVRRTTFETPNWARFRRVASRKEGEVCQCSLPEACNWQRILPHRGQALSLPLHTCNRLPSGMLPNRLSFQEWHTASSRIQTSPPCQSVCQLWVPHR
jgi:hypothetical protein